MLPAKKTIPQRSKLEVNEHVNISFFSEISKLSIMNKFYFINRKQVCFKCKHVYV